MSMRVDAYVLM